MHIVKDNFPLYYTEGKSMGYLNVPLIIDKAVENKCFIILGVGGRGTGKTYGGLDFCEESSVPYIYMRRKQKHVNMSCRPELSPFKKLNKDKKRCTQCFKIPETDVAGIYNAEYDEEKGVYKPVGLQKGYALSLSTFHDTRSVDFSEAIYLFYDEFVPEKRERIIADEGYTFNNVYETVNRNRELDGERPLVAFCFANSEKLDNALFMYYGIVKTAMEMRKKGDEVIYIKDKGICLIDMVKSPISAKKADTFLYNKANKDSRFSDMAIKNQYDIDDAVPILDHKIDYRQYMPVCAPGEINIYKHKSKDEYLVTYKNVGQFDRYSVTAYDMTRYINRYRYLYYANSRGSVVFEDYTAYILFENYMRYK